MTQNPNIYDLAIIGGGPAGIAAGVYAARKKIKTVFITKHFQGQSSVSENIENWIGEKSISGTDLAKKMEEHLKALAGEIIDIKEGEEADLISPKGKDFTIKTDRDEYQTRTVLVTTGSGRRKLSVPGADKFEHKGLTYCATCDAPMFGGLDVIVIGGGNSAFEAAMQLTAYANKITIMHRSEEFRADPVTIARVLDHGKISAIKNIDLLEITGDKFVNGVKYKIKGHDKIITMPISGIFVEIGHTANSDHIEELVKVDANKQIIVDPKTQRTSVTGIWAAGDCTDGLYKQNNIAVGDAVKALEDIYKFLKTK
jgi:alkyl hydroperoxide reductase subunit F